MKAQGTLTLPKMDRVEVSPGIFLIGEPAPVPGTNKLRCLANVGGCLVLVELKVNFVASQEVCLGVA